MSQIPENLHYASSHEWVRVEQDQTATVGITDHAQNQLGDLVFVDLPAVSAQIKAGDDVVVVESVKTASDVYSPVSGEVIEINQKLSNEPGAINNSPYENGWLYRIKLDDSSELDNLLNASRYQSQIESE